MRAEFFDADPAGPAKLLYSVAHTKKVETGTQFGSFFPQKLTSWVFNDQPFGSGDPRIK